MKTALSIFLLMAAPAFALPDAQPAQAVTAQSLSAEMDGYLAFLGRFSALPQTPFADVARDVVSGLKGGRYDALVMGETHTNPNELAAGVALVKDVKAAGIPIGMLLRESNLFPDTSFLAPETLVRTFANQFEPDAPIAKVIPMLNGGILITYTGHSHTSRTIRDNALAIKSFFGSYGPGKKLMTTIQDSLEKNGRKPVIVAMITEDSILDRISFMTLAEVTKNVTLPQAARQLDYLIRIWESKLPQRMKTGQLYFVRDPRHPEFYAGITSGQRMPLKLLAVKKTLVLPELAQWAGNTVLRGVECLPQMDETGTYFRVVVHKTGSDETFDRYISAATGQFVNMPS